MLEQDKKDFKEELTAVMDLYDKDKPTNPVLRHWWDALKDYPLNVVIDCINKHVKKSKFAPKPADIIEQIITQDGRPTAEEAWATALLSSNEAETIIWTDEISQALSMGAGDLLADGDKTAARMAFRDSYSRLVAQSRELGVPVNVWISQGHDTQRRGSAIEQAKAKGLISPAYAKSLMIDYKAPINKKFLRLATTAISEEDKVKRKQNMEKMRLIVAK